MNMQELLALRQTEVEAAAQAFKQAQAQLQLTQVHYRLAHINVQPEPLNELAKNEELDAREKMIAAAYFVVTGQLPQINPKPEEPKDGAPNAEGTEPAGQGGEGPEAHEEASEEVEADTEAAGEGSEGSEQSNHD